MNFDQLIASTARKSGGALTQYIVRKVMRAVFREIMDCLSRGEELEIKGYISFRLIDQPPRKRITPQGKEIRWPATQRIRVLAGVHLKKAAGLHVRDRRKDKDDYLEYLPR